MIGYLTGEEINKLKEAGVTSCLFSTSDTRQYFGDLTCVYFLAGDNEIAHQTQLSGDSALGIPNVDYYRRSFTYHSACKRSHLFDRLLENGELCGSVIYRVIPDYQK